MCSLAPHTIYGVCCCEEVERNGHDWHIRDKVARIIRVAIAECWQTFVAKMHKAKAEDNIPDHLHVESLDQLIKERLLDNIAVG